MERPGLDVDELRDALGVRWAAVEVVEQTTSTNADLLARQDAADRSVLVAEFQSAGRGRLERSWESPARAGLTFSVLLRPSPPIVTWGWLPLLAGVAIRDALVDVAGVTAALKWPNDVLAKGGPPASQGVARGGGGPPASEDGGPPGREGVAAGGVAGGGSRKLAGVLAQTSREAVVIGIGLNVTTSADELPVDMATSLAQCGARVLDRGRLLVAMLTNLDARVTQWSDAGGDAEACGLAAAYRDACATLGQEVEVTVTVPADPAVAARRFLGVAVAVDPDGRLRVRTRDGDEVVGAGDVRHVRPALG